MKPVTKHRDSAVTRLLQTPTIMQQKAAWTDQTLISSNSNFSLISPERYLDFQQTDLHIHHVLVMFPSRCVAFAINHYPYQTVEIFHGYMPCSCQTVFQYAPIKEFKS